MIAILNTTFVIEQSIEAEVLLWIRNSYAKSAAKLLTTTPLLMKVLAPVQDHETEAHSYALQLKFESLQVAQKWNDGLADALRKIMLERWGEKVLVFYTFLLPID